jgi:hypothetical protein
VGERQATVPFGVHQVIEYLLGVFALTSIARVEPKSAVLCAGAGAGLIALAALSGGRPGAVGFLAPRVHRVVDYAAVAALATSPWWSGTGWSAGAVWVVEALAVALLWLTRATAYRRRPPAPEVDESLAAPTTGALPDAARKAGRLAGALARKGPKAAGVAVGRIKKRRR